MPKKSKDIEYYEGVGRRSEAVARVRLYIAGKDKTATVDGKKINQGDVVINGKPLKTIYTRLAEQKRLLHPLHITDNHNRFVVTVTTKGGGKIGQLEAIMHGLSRALNQADPDTYKSVLREHNLLTRDARTRERRKVGMGGKARREKQSPKR